MKKVTVVTVTQNACDALRKTMQSVANQTYPDVEYIVVDGASTDGSRELLEKSKGVRWISEPDRGIYDAMNKGAQMATGEWIIFMNAGDCFATNDSLELMLGGVESKAVDVVYGDVIRHGKLCQASDKVVDGHRMFFCHQSCIARTKLLIATPFDIKHRLSADFKWVKTMIKQGRKFKHIAVPVAVFDTSGVSNSSRSLSLADNIKVVCEMESPLRCIKLLPHLFVPYALCRLRGK